MDPARTFALRLRDDGTAAPQPIAGRLEHVMSGRCADFTDAAQLVAALRQLAGSDMPSPPPSERTTMTPDTVRTVRETWAPVAAAGPAAAALFYEQLFATDPTLRPLFRAPLHEQGARLVQMLDAAVAGLGEPQRLLPMLRALGARHAGYGVREAHYASVGQALLRTLELALGEAFTPAVRAAWAEVYGVVAQAMREGAG
jgi:hemoglobin-like flavoprotein